ncbi:uncharacterized protein TRIADDRAFT_61452 [Trichoplax adhaerens]|uniref:G-protein coupled receptors family 2 profile 2 domain-containing protein n=1 Tax=Trichoplax adhaerens TaxID=10228 RepID=B3SB10_TRIAD|nr:predicted protein [Trichoplax adhaerens]EDV20080.1 predicted protein [Trichoplax adhaerens]|eukprot:XP_002117464.1 predicted protein [Trichoplax adhaerens]
MYESRNFSRFFDEYDLLLASMDIDEILMSQFYQEAFESSHKVAVYVSDVLGIIESLYEVFISTFQELEHDGHWIAQCLYQAAYKVANVTSCGSKPQTIRPAMEVLKEFIGNNIICCQTYEQASTLKQCWRTSYGHKVKENNETNMKKYDINYNSKPLLFQWFNIAMGWISITFILLTWGFVIAASVSLTMKWKVRCNIAIAVILTDVMIAVVIPFLPAKEKSPLCIAKGIVLHYMILACFTCMFVQCLHQYRHRKNKNANDSRMWIFTYFLIGWMLPTVPITVASLVDPWIYHPTLKVFGQNMCWLHGINNFYFVIPLPAIVVISLPFLMYSTQDELKELKIKDWCCKDGEDSKEFHAFNAEEHRARKYVNYDIAIIYLSILIKKGSSCFQTKKKLIVEDKVDINEALEALDDFNFFPY